MRWKHVLVETWKRPEESYELLVSSNWVLFRRVLGCSFSHTSPSHSLPRTRCFILVETAGSRSHCFDDCRSCRCRCMAILRSVVKWLSSKCVLRYFQLLRMPRLRQLQQTVFSIERIILARQAKAGGLWSLSLSCAPHNTSIYRFSRKCFSFVGITA